jgi:hypothetical protein
MSSFDAYVGALVHRQVGELLSEQRTISASDLFRRSCDLVREQPFGGLERHGAQRVAGLTRIALDLVLPWTFCGAEVSTGDGRVDLVWEEPSTKLIVVDEVKVAGVGAVIDDASTHAQVRRYLRWGVAEFEERFVGVRLLALSTPRRSLVFVPGSPNVPHRLVSSWLWTSSSIPAEVG